jgi:hypothetical protein
VNRLALFLLCSAALVLVALPANAAQSTQCNGVSDIGSRAAAGCFHRDKRLGPKVLPGRSDPVGKLTRGYDRFGRSPVLASCAASGAARRHRGTGATRRATASPARR